MADEQNTTNEMAKQEQGSRVVRTAKTHYPCGKRRRTPEQNIRHTEQMRRWTQAHPSTDESRSLYRARRKSRFLALSPSEQDRVVSKDKARRSTPEAKARSKTRASNRWRGMTKEQRNSYLAKRKRQRAHRTDAQKQLEREWSRRSIERHGHSKPKESTVYRHSLKKVGVTPSQYQELHDRQAGACGICGTTDPKPNKRLAVDHCHITGNLRGLLCRKCNSAIGMLRDDAGLVANALAWLEKPPAIIKESA